MNEKKTYILIAARVSIPFSSVKNYAVLSRHAHLIRLKMAITLAQPYLINSYVRCRYVVMVLSLTTYPRCKVWHSTLGFLPSVYHTRGITVGRQFPVAYQLTC